ncbi:ATP-binding protein [Abyssogena phaseoliformis symbiont]
MVIEDNAGGIHRDNLQRAITMGRSSNDPHRNNSLSVYGMGLKSAAI